MTDLSRPGVLVNAFKDTNVATIAAAPENPVNQVGDILDQDQSGDVSHRSGYLGW